MNNLCPHITNSYISFSVAGKSIFKDQCMKCYDDQKSEEGLDICLKCFTAHCHSEIFNHSQSHYYMKNHPVFLNIKEVLIPNDFQKEKEENKITKLAIGKPGGADFSDEKWERWIKINCKSCQKDFEVEQNPTLKELVTSILFKADANEQSNIKAWEQEIFPCEHTLTLEQWESKKIASKMMATCNNCNLSSNLWLCLTCGNLGCGRKNYDGTGGNSHAIGHFESSGHPLVVKTGTITPEGDASIYCYACNDDVKDPELATHLHSFGIDIATQKKTDKTVTEMNLEFNLNFTLSKALEEGKVFTPVYGPGYTGMENLGNSCYMNSVVQILFSLEAFQSQYLDYAIEHLSTCGDETQNCFYCQVCKLVYGLYSGLYSAKRTRTLPKVDENSPEVVEEYQNGIKPSSFKHYFGKDHPEFSTNKQQDAFEYLSHLLEKFEKQEKALGRPNPKSVFEFDMENRLECVKCHGVKYKKQRTCFLNLTIPKWEDKKNEGSICSFEETINKFLGEELVELNCSQCKQSTNWIKTQRIKNFPKYLIIIFERFVYDWVPLKLEVAFKPPVEKFNFDVIASNHSKQSEHVISEDNGEEKIEEVEPKFDASKVEILMSCGIPELASKHALLFNDNDADRALNWYFENMDNPILNAPIQKSKQKSQMGSQKVPSISESLVSELISFGFSRSQAEGSLRKCENNLERAADYLFTHPDENFEIISEKEDNLNADNQINVNNSSEFELYAFITHLGKNTSHGHYVSHIKKENEWIYYNDNKVNIDSDPPIQKGYIYFYKSS